MKKIMLIEDDTELYSLLKYNFEKEGYAISGSQTGAGAVSLCRRERPDLAILDVMLPDTDGFEICRRMRADPETAHVPIIFLTARAAETDRIVGLELGASDYVVKPFFVKELIARVKLHLRIPAKPGRLLKGERVVIDRQACRALLDGEPLSLTPTEFRLLEYLMSSPGEVFSREQLLNAVWGRDRVLTDRTVDVYILRLRQKICDDPANPSMLHSVRGFGYCYQEPDSYPPQPPEMAANGVNQV